MTVWMFVFPENRRIGMNIIAVDVSASGTCGVCVKLDENRYVDLNIYEPSLANKTSEFLSEVINRKLLKECLSPWGSYFCLRPGVLY